MRFTRLLLPTFLIAGTAFVQASRADSESDDSGFRSAIKVIVGFSKTVSASSSFFTSLVTGDSGTSILNAPRSMWGE